MRKIEREMLTAIQAREDWRKNNTEVRVTKENYRTIIAVFLHGNHIADVRVNGEVMPNLETLEAWPTPTTKSRLRALGVNVTQSRGVVAIDGEIVCHV